MVRARYPAAKWVYAALQNFCREKCVGQSAFFKKKKDSLLIQLNSFCLSDRDLDKS